MEKWSRAPGGGDLTIIKREIARCRKANRFHDVGLLKLIASGGIWTLKRKYEAKLVDSPICPYCEVEEEDDFHFFWGCRCLKTSTSSHDSYKASRLPAVMRTAGHWWCPDPDSENFTPCFYLRGIPPREWTTPDIVPYNENDGGYD